MAGEMLARVRKLIRQAVPEVVETWKWRGVPVWEHAGIICTGETYKAVVKLTFAKGASLEDPSGLFNSSLEGNVRRAIDIHEGDKIDEKALKALIRAAVALNTSSAAKRRGQSVDDGRGFAAEWEREKTHPQLPGTPWMAGKNMSCQRAGRILMLPTVAMKSAYFMRLSGDVV